MSAQEKLQSQVCFQLYTGSRLLQRMYRPYFDRWGITYLQYLILLALWEEDGKTISELGTLVDLDSGTLSPLLKRMEHAGLVYRKIDDRDYRRSFFYVTEYGYSLQPQAEAMIVDIESGLGIDAADQHALRTILAKINPSFS